jgi:hypothetical protein
MRTLADAVGSGSGREEWEEDGEESQVGRHETLARAPLSDGKMDAVYCEHIGNQE